MSNLAGEPQHGIYVSELGLKPAPKISLFVGKAIVETPSPLRYVHWSNVEMLSYSQEGIRSPFHLKTVLGCSWYQNKKFRNFAPSKANGSFGTTKRRPMYAAIG